MHSLLTGRYKVVRDIFIRVCMHLLPTVRYTSSLTCCWPADIHTDIETYHEIDITCT